MSADHAELYAALAALLAGALPERWMRAEVLVRAGDAGEPGRLGFETRYLDEAHTRHRLALDTRLLGIHFVALRERASDAPWQHARFTLFPNGLFDCAFGYDAGEPLGA